MTDFPQNGTLAEWQECRNTIGRLDTTLADLRKFGFGLVTVLITAGGLVGTQLSGKAVSAPVAIMVLIVTLFIVDRYYTLLQSGAVERALDLEGERINFEDLSQDRLTQVISVHAINSRTVFVVPVLHLGLLVAAWLLAAAPAEFASVPFNMSFGILFAFIVAYFVYTELKSKTGSFASRRFERPQKHKCSPPTRDGSGESGAP